MRIKSFIVACAALVAVVANGPAAAQPCAGFTDVSGTSSFCPNVEWLKNRAITVGCTSATLYCPNDPVTRLSMAIFMNRLGVALTPIELTPVNAAAIAVNPTLNPVLCATPDARLCSNRLSASRIRERRGASFVPDGRCRCPRERSHIDQQRRLVVPDRKQRPLRVVVPGIDARPARVARALRLGRSCRRADGALCRRGHTLRGHGHQRHGRMQLVGSDRQSQRTVEPVRSLARRRIGNPTTAPVGAVVVCGPGSICQNRPR